MGSISSLGSYLSSLLSSSSGSSTSSSAAALQALDQELSGTSSSSGSGVGSYLLDLSPAAQQILSGASTGTTSGSGSSSNFTLTKAQQTAIENIIDKFKDAPFTQATFTEITNALQAAGLSPEQLAAKDEITSFNPTTVLLGDLSGNYTSVPSAAKTLSNEQTKENNFLQDIEKFWKSISTTASSASGSASSGSGASS